MRLQSALVICHLVSDLKYISIKAQSHRSNPGLKVSFKGTINPQSTSRFSTANMKSKLSLITFILHVPGFIVTDSKITIVLFRTANYSYYFAVYNVNLVCCMEYPSDIQHLLKCAVFMLGIC